MQLFWSISSWDVCDCTDSLQSQADSWCIPDWRLDYFQVPEKLAFFEVSWVLLLMLGCVLAKVIAIKDVH